MKKALTQVGNNTYYHQDNQKIEGVPADIYGSLYGISGNLSGISGDLDDCEITDEERRLGIDVKDLLK